MQPQVQAFFDPATGSLSYVIYEQPGSACAIVDPVLDYDASTGRTRSITSASPPTMIAS